jgi:hypothetical protein
MVSHFILWVGLVLAIGPQVFAQRVGLVTFGSEFNFTNSELLRLREKAKAEAQVFTGGQILKAANEYFNTYNLLMVKLQDLILQNCDDCSLVKATDLKKTQNFPTREYYEFTIETNGVRINFTADVGVLEVKMSPTTSEVIANLQEKLQQIIFKAAAQVGLQSYRNTGHLHLGFASGFANDLLLVRNFIVDMTANARVFNEIFANSQRNTISIDLLALNSKDSGNFHVERFTSIIADFDQTVDWSLRHDPEYVRKMAQLLIAGIQQEVYLKSDRNAKLHFLNLRHFQFLQAAISLDAETFELRGMPEVSSAKEYLALTRLFEGRLFYLKNLSVPISFTGVIQPKNKIDAARIFYEFGQDAGSEKSDMTLLLRRSPFVRVRGFAWFGPWRAKVLRCEAMWF